MECRKIASRFSTSSGTPPACRRIRTERPRGRGVRLVELDVATPAAATSHRDVRIVGEGRIDDGPELAQLYREHIISPRFARIYGPHDPVHITELIRPGPAANETRTGGLVIHACGHGIEKVRCDAGPLHLQPVATVGVLQMAPGRRTALASAGDAEVRLGATGADDVTAPGQKVARGLGARRASSKHQRSHPNEGSDSK